MTKEIKNINRAFYRLDKELKRYRAVCALNGAVLRGVTFRVMEDGGSHTAVRWRREANNA